MLILLLCIQFLTYISACGPGGGSRRKRIRLQNFSGDRIPNIAEHSAAASGPFQSALHRNDPRLGQILATDIIFKDTSYNADARKAIKPCRDSLIKLAGVVKSFWGDRYKLYVLEGYLPHGNDAHLKHGKQSLHFSGRAFDVTLTNSPGIKDDDNNKFTKLGKTVPKHTLRSLAGLAYWNARFTYVQIIGNHLHLSCDTTVQKTSSSRCFSGESFVRNSANQKISMKDVKVGDKVLTTNADGRTEFSEVTMLMHRNPTVHVTDYVKISSKNGKSITLSPHHMIFTFEAQSVFSKDVKINQNIFVYDSLTGNIDTSAVTNISRVTKQGAYAPLTNSGTIIVDDVHASCYALFPSHTLSHAAFSVWRIIYPFLSRTSKLVETEEYHWYVNAWRHSINYLNVFPYSM